MAWFTQGSEEYGEHGEMLLQFFLDDEENDNRVVVRISELVRCLKHFRESVLSNDEHDYEYEMAGNLWAAPPESGTLTAEQVREAVLENFEETHETRYDHWEPSKFDWQAITDELNAELGGGTCRNQWQWNSGFCCSECFYTVPFVGKFANSPFAYCPNCGCKVVSA